MTPFVECETDAIKDRSAFINDLARRLKLAGQKPNKRYLVKEYHRQRRYRMFKNDKYTVILDPRVDDMLTPDPRIKVLHLSIRHNDRSAGMDWREFQQIKSEIVGPHHEGLMLYPSEDRLVDCSNQYHIFIPVSETGEPLGIPFGWNTERVTITPEQAQHLGAVQRG